MSQQYHTSKEIIEQLKNDQSDGKVKVAITDIDGILRGKYIHRNKFESALESGFGFCNVVFGWDMADICYDHVPYTGWHTGYPDAKVMLDMETARKIPWDSNVPFFLGDFVTGDGNEPLPVCPRQLLKKILAEAKSLGFNARVGCEFEWFNFSETPETLHQKDFTKLNPITPGMFGYSLLRASQRSEYFNDLFDLLQSFRVPLEGIHTETGPGVYEAAILNDHALEAADRAVLFKASVKEIASRHAIVPTFMARWNNDLPGTSGHIHQSLESTSGVNQFFDNSDPHQMSSTFKSYLAGQIHCLPELLVMFAPTINSYKRLVEGFWAPTRSTWGIDNRTCALRVISGSEKSTRVEVRVPGADVNPYLGIAASIGAGLYGIKNKLSLEQKPIAGNGYEDKIATAFPRNLYDAANAFKDSKIARELFGDAFVEHFATTRLWEWSQFQQGITDWELKRYFELV